MVILKKLFGNPFFAAGLTFFLLCLNVFLNLPRTQFFYILTGAWIVLAILAKPLRERIMDRLGRVFTRNRTIILFTLFLVFIFQIRFPLKDWNQIILEDDYTLFFVSSMKSIEVMKEGGLFGWDSKVLGGYPMVSEAPVNKSMFLWPFVAVLGPPVGFHVFIFTFFMLFPFLCMSYARILFRDKTLETLTFAFSAIFLLSFFRNILTFGMIDTLLGLNFLVLNLILFEKVKGGSGWAAFALSLSVSCTMYSHIGLFFISLFFIAIELFTNFSKRLFYCTFMVLSFSFFMTIHNTFYFLYYRSYFPTNFEYYDPSVVTLAHQLARNVKYFVELFDITKAFTLRYNLENLIMAFIPILVYMILKGEGRSRKIAVFLLLIPLIRGIELPGTMVLTMRIGLVTVLYLPVILSVFIGAELRKRYLHNLVLLPLLFLPTLGTHTWYAMRHIKSIKNEFPGFYNGVKAMDGHTILLEVVSHLNVMTDKDKFRSEFPTQGLTHWENLISMEMPDKRFLTSTTECYHFVCYRDNFINSGGYKGEPIDHFTVDEINALLKKWGVKYIIVWSKRSIGFFSRAREDYQFMGHYKRWHVFKFLKSDPRGIVLRQGEGRSEDLGYFGKRLFLKGAAQGDTAVIRENYFPSWRAFYKGSEIQVFNVDMQMAIVVPENGNIEIDMRFPKYHIFTLFGFVSLLLSFLFFVKLGISRYFIKPDPSFKGVG